jgi:DNA-binding MarR family transcriptional regulator
MKMQLVRNYLGRLTSTERGVGEKERVQELFERAANFRSMARDILGMAEELEGEAMSLIGSSRDEEIVKMDHGPRRSRFVDVARNQYRGRRVRERYFDKKIFGEPAWDMLLELYASEINEEKISTSNLILSSSSPSSTALRWIKHLEDHGMVVKKSSPIDGRVQYQRITATGFESMTKYFESISEKK